MAVRGTRQRALLAVLLLGRGAPVSRDRLLEDLWGEHVPDGAVKALQVAASRLRRALLQEGGRLVGTPGGYRLLLEPGELDLDRFESLAEEGRRAIAGGHADRAALRLRAALAEWRGPPLADLAFEPFAQAEVVRLQALRAAAVSDRIDADLLMGKHAELVPELEALVLDHPLEERLRAQLIQALHRAGRRGEALAAYRDAVRVLEAELGLHPGPELERAQRAVLEADPESAPERSAGAATQRRATATVLATELAGLTRIRAERGDEQADAVRREHDPLVRDALSEHGGCELNMLGDGFLAAFESAAAAVTCAIGIQRAVDRQSQGAAGMPPVRIGIAAGDVTWEGEQLSGMPVAEAVRLCAAADPGRILVDDAVRLLAGPASEVPLEDAGELSLPDLGRPVSAWEVRWDVRRMVIPPLAPALVADDAPAFAGRAVELAALRTAWREASEGQRRGVLLAGEPGIGKTRLAAELAEHAATHGGVVLYGRCDDGPAAPAQPFAEALSAYALACPRGELRAQLGEHAGDLQVIVPSLRARLADVAEAPPAAPEVERLRTLEAASALLEAASRPAPVLLVVDDLHWADELSLLLLQHLMRADTPARLLVVATYRDSEPSRTPLLADVVTGLARRPGVTRLELAPLTQPDVAALLEDAGRGTALAPRVRAMTEGNPFFVGEVIQALVEGAGGAPLVTPRVRDVVRWRLARLPPEVGDVLTVAAVAGPEFDVDVIAIASAAGNDGVLDALEAAESARLVRPAGALDRFAFAHALVRQAIVEDLPAGRRVRLHARVAEALERLALVRAVPAADLAAHHDSAGALVEAPTTLRHARRAGDEAAGRLAFDIAAEHYERARRAHARIPDAPATERLELDVALARSLRLAGDERARDALLQVAVEAERAGDGARMVDALVSLTLGVATGFLAEDARALELLRRALSVLNTGDSAARVRARACLALSAEFALPEHERRAMADEALAMARRVGEPEALAFALNAHLWIAMEPTRRHERLAMADDLVRIGARASPYAECDGHRFRFVSLVEDGDLRRADQALAAARASARLPVSQWAVCQFDAARAVLAGRLADAERLMLEGALAAQEAGFDLAVVQGSAASVLWCIRRAQGRLGELWEAMVEVEGAPDTRAWMLAGVAQVAMARSDDRTARRAISTAFAMGLLDMPRGLYWLSTMAGTAEVCAWLGDIDGAKKLDVVLRPCADVLSPWTGPVSLSAGAVALTLGRHDEAEARFRDAVSLCERARLPAYEAIAQYELGRILTPTGEGRRLLERAQASAERIGMPGWAARAEEALHDTRVLGTGHPQPPRDPGRPRDANTPLGQNRGKS